MPRFYTPPRGTARRFELWREGDSTMPVAIPGSVLRPCSSSESELLCPTCGSANVVEAAYTAAEVIFRCLHYWKLFTRRL
jgi:hypothetical protein